MIEEHFDDIEGIIRDDLLVIFLDFHRVYAGPKTAYIKGKVRFIDNSLLSLFQHVCFKEGKLIITDYRYHYMDSKNRLIFRYDNAPHHPDLTTFPHHKHISSGEKESGMPSIEDLLTEIHQHIIGEIISDLN